MLEPGGDPVSRERLHRLLDGTCPLAEPPAPPAGWGVPAAVLIGLLGHAEGPSIILTQRTAGLVNHPAEISLPGGRIEAHDDDPGAAALREASEEIGLSPEKVEILGCLPPSETISGFRVYPVVGWIEPPVDFEPDRREVEAVFELPLSFLLDSTNHHSGSVFYRGERHHFPVLPYRGHRVWGATAGILVDFARMITV
jgi:8-oxo-dGTP pyrophosphatase MutT (NUDIX family)